MPLRGAHINSELKQTNKQAKQHFQRAVSAGVASFPPLFELLLISHLPGARAKAPDIPAQSHWGTEGLPLWRTGHPSGTGQGTVGKQLESKKCQLESSRLLVGGSQKPGVLLSLPQPLHPVVLSLNDVQSPSLLCLNNQHLSLDTSFLACLPAPPCAFL